MRLSTDWERVDTEPPVGLHVGLECTRTWDGISSNSSELNRKRGSDLLPEINVFHPQRGGY